MRRKSRTSCWSKPRRAVPNAASATAAGDDGSGREKEMAIAAERKRGAAARIAAMQLDGGLAAERVAAEPLERGERLVERGDRDDLDVVAGDLAGPRDLLVALRRSGTRKWSTPTWRTADTFWARPPIAPTVPSRSIVAGDGDVGAAGEVALATARRSASA